MNKDLKLVQCPSCRQKGNNVLKVGDLINKLRRMSVVELREGDSFLCYTENIILLNIFAEREVIDWYITRNNGVDIIVINVKECAE